MKRWIICLILFVVVFAFGAKTTAWAQTATPPPTPAPTLPPGALPDDNAYGFKFTQEEQAAYFDAVSNCETPSLECLVHNVTRFSAMEWIFNILGSEHRNKLAAQAEFEKQNHIASAGGGGLVEGLGYLMGAMYEKPVASTSTYVADLFKSAHIAPPAYAQGLGFASLDPILPLWKQFRNLSYLFFVIIFIVIGFMIMFRTKIGGNTAVTAQQAIPRVIIALLAVTFSYAIGGFLIDMMYLSMILIIGIFGETFGTTNILSYNIIQLFGVLWNAGPANVGGNISISKAFIDGFSGGGAATTAVLGILGGLLLTLLLAVAVLIGTVRLFFELLKSYATIVLSITTAPLTLMVGAIPGKNAFGPWVKDLVGNLIPFPLVLLVVIMFYQFTSEGASTGGSFNPPFLLNSSAAGVLPSLMGLAIILSLPDIVKKIKEPLVSKGFGTFLFDTAVTNAKQAYQKGRRGVSYAASAQPIGGSDYSNLRLGGQESKLERMLVGTRANRKAQVDRLQRRFDYAVSTGTLNAEEAKKQYSVPVEFGGVAGALLNKRRQKLDAMSQPVGAGSGVNPAATPKPQSTPTRIPQRRPTRTPVI